MTIPNEADQREADSLRWLDAYSLMVGETHAFPNYDEPGTIEATVGSQALLAIIDEWRNTSIRKGSILAMSASIEDAMAWLRAPENEATCEQLIKWASFFDEQANKLREAADYFVALEKGEATWP